MPDSFMPSLISVGGVILAIAINQWLMKREHSRQESAEVTKAKIDDGTLLRKELWQRVTNLEVSLQAERLGSEKLRTEVNALTISNQTLKEELAAARAEIRSLVAQLSALRGM